MGACCLLHIRAFHLQNKGLVKAGSPVPAPMLKLTGSEA